MAFVQPTYSGLTSAEVRERMKRGESNDFQPRVGRSYWQIIRDNVFNLFNVVLFTLLLIVVYFRDYPTALFAGFSVVTNSLMGMFQEMAAKRKLDRLAAMQAQTVRVWRDGKLTTIPIHQIVKEDVIAIEPGDRLPVDGRVLHSDALEIDESHLTGESDAVFKNVDDPLYSGSFCTAGTGVMAATQVGKDSTINKLSVIAKAYKNVRTPTQDKISAIVEITVVIMLIFLPMIIFAGALSHLTPLEIVKNCVVFVTSLVPQGLVLTAILSLTLGAINISRHQTLIQRVNAVESLANVTVLCFDKTGTITRNQLAVTDVLPLNEMPVEEVHHRLLTYLNNLSHLNRTANAVAEYAWAQNGKSGDGVPKKVAEVPFTSTRKWGAVVLPDETLILGAPERVLCPEEHDAAQRAEQLSAEGMRVLAFARSPSPPQDSNLDDQRESLALIVLSDQVRDDIQDTLEAFRRQNVGLKVISGDNLRTVEAIARQAGLIYIKSYRGSELAAMSDEALETAALNGDLFARVEPETKRRLVAAMKRRGHYVAMVGDGVNDVPALKEAHLAIVMNDGTQMSKDIAEIVLLNNAMSTLPRAFEEGTAITQVIYGTTKLFLIKNFYSILLFVFVAFMALPFAISPIQISWVTFGTVNIPAGLIAFKLLHPQFMQRFRRDVLEVVFTGGIIGAVTLALLYAATYFFSGSNQDAARSAITVFIIFWEVIIFWNVQGIDLFALRTWVEHKGSILLGVVLMLLTVAIPYMLPRLFVFVPPTLPRIGLIAILLLVTMTLFQYALHNRGLIRRFWHLMGE